jgi:hypothetical protein
MNQKADITFHQDEGGGFVAVPNPFVLEKDVTRIRIGNDSPTDIQLNLREAPVEEDELRIGARAVESVTVKRTVSEGQYGYGVSAVPPVRRHGGLEASPKIIVEASPKIIAEASPKIIVERSFKPGVTPREG